MSDFTVKLLYSVFSYIHETAQVSDINGCSGQVSSVSENRLCCVTETELQIPVYHFPYLAQARQSY